MLTSFVSVAQVDVVESSSVEQIQQAEQEQEQNNANAELLYQLQLLQEEMMQIRGTLEEQAHEIRQLKQQRLDDYINLDKRLSDLTAAQAARPAPVVGSTQAGTAPAISASDGATDATAPATAAGSDNAVIDIPPPAVSDKTEYRAAYQLIKNRQFEEAKKAFTSFLNAHSTSSYVPNAHYWLGELYILDANYKAAKAEFAKVLNNYPDHRKFPEALLKIAKVNYELGDRDVAKKQLEELLDKYSERSENTTRLAREFLSKHYP